jgi:hypothetical protein
MELVPRRVVVNQLRLLGKTASEIASKNTRLVSDEYPEVKLNYLSKSAILPLKRASPSGEPYRPSPTARKAGQCGVGGLIQAKSEMISEKWTGSLPAGISSLLPCEPDFTLVLEYAHYVRSIWSSQRQELQRLAERLGIHEKQGNLKSAIQLGELLTLAPNITTAARLIEEDSEGAASFLDVVASMDEVIADAGDTPSTSKLHGPFHELADFVVEFLNELRELDPRKFK